MKETKDLTKLSSLSSIISAFLASSCCILPIVFALLGVGSAGFLMGLEKYRPIFISIASISLGVSFYYTYWKKETSCKTDSVCSTDKGSKLNKIMLWVSAVLVVSFIVFPYLAEWIFG